MEPTKANSIYPFEAKDIKGGLIKMDQYKGKVLLIVNTASRCVFTSQYQSLEKLNQIFDSQKFEILGFPCNQFGEQEPGTDEEIAEFSLVECAVTFTMFSKIEVNGDNALPLFQFLKSACPGTMGTTLIKWNFTKFLIDRNGVPIERYAPQADPIRLQEPIEALLKQEVES